MKLEEFNLHTESTELAKGIALFKDGKFKLKAVRNDCYHFVDVDNQEVKIILDDDEIVYAHCDGEHEGDGYCAHEAACFLAIIAYKDPDFNVRDHQKSAEDEEEDLAEGYFNILKDYQEMVANGEFDLGAFLQNKSKDELILILTMFDAINPELGVFIFQLFYDELVKDKEES